MEEILYLKDDKEKVIVYYDYKNEEVHSVYSFLNKLASINLFSLSVYRQKVAKNIGIKSTIPIYFNHHTMLFSLLDNFGYKYWINYFSLTDILYQKGYCMLLFKQGDFLKIAVSKQKLSNVMHKINKIIDYINKI